jgi:hypothetical protein
MHSKSRTFVHGVINRFSTTYPPGYQPVIAVIPGSESYDAIHLVAAPVWIASLRSQ